MTAVAKGSPADGVLNCDDVILGVGNKSFDGDARIQFGKAITVAEQVKNGGVLKLIRWRAGKTETVQLKLAVMGSYSGTAPYDCQKSKKIFEQGCQTIAKKGLSKATIDNDLNALALLASGKKKYRPMLAEYAKKISASLHPGKWTWFYGYGNIFLAEYVLSTGDKSILPELKRTAKEAAMSQSVAGMWGHEFYLTPSGNLNGYGAMNQTALSQTIGLVLARQAGVNDPAVDQAIAKSARVLRWFVDKGGIPYGDHLPWPGYESNGKSSSAAVLFDLLGDSATSSFYSRMSTAAYSERERGHTGIFFNVLWSLPGVSRCGPLATGAYLKEQSWYYDLARGWDGSFGYQGSPVGEEDHGKYAKWNCTGAYMLAYALPLKSLYLTGKKPCSVQALNKKEVAEGIDRQLLYPAIRLALQNDDAVARRSIAPILGQLTDRDLAVLLPDIIKAIEKLAPSNEMFGDVIRVEGLSLLAKKRIIEGLPLCLNIMEIQRHGKKNRVVPCLKSLEIYGPAAVKTILPELKQMEKDLLKHQEANNVLSDGIKKIHKMIAEAEAATGKPEFISLAQFIRENK